jgi:hypothetical protein
VYKTAGLRVRQKKEIMNIFFVVRDKARTKTKKMIDHIFFTGVFVRQLTMKLPSVSGKTNIMYIALTISHWVVFWDQEMYTVP